MNKFHSGYPTAGHITRPSVAPLPLPISLVLRWRANKVGIMKSSNASKKAPRNNLTATSYIEIF